MIASLTDRRVHLMSEFIAGIQVMKMYAWEKSFSQIVSEPGQLCAVISAVGSGKLSILHLLLKELNPGIDSIILTQGCSKYNFPGNLSTGYFTNNPNLRISYASQELWLFGGTVRDDILFGRSYNKARYMQFLFDQLANVSGSCVHLDKGFLQRDMTTVGDRSVSLSGGQRAHLYRKCITEYLHGKTRILVTSQLQFLKRANHIVVLDRVT
ncbi:Multidrug resistance-associated protein 4 [Acromyrmex echinatior]|uniref:Multidrug resistance-associated protein 4 n=1 Tax=Acromyrmex echinatior TaxID=103372 RepID=F4W7R7_ACREC|nr:Multidrug resistance-associated protein 4 [Acromyrmex echinatior]